MGSSRYIDIILNLVLYLHFLDDLQGIQHKRLEQFPLGKYIALSQPLPLWEKTGKIEASEQLIRPGFKATDRERRISNNSCQFAGHTLVSNRSKVMERKIPGNCWGAKNRGGNSESNEIMCGRRKNIN